MNPKSLLAPAAALLPSERDQLFALMDRYYENVSRAAFESDLAEKDWVILLVGSDDVICGFSTQMLLTVTVEGRPVQALFSGDTIVDRRHWGSNALGCVWGRLALQLIDRLPGEELYWFLISKGYRTYRYLPLFFHEYYPRHDRSTPEGVTTILDSLGRHKFSRAYDARRGLVRGSPAKDRLRSGTGQITDERLRDPHVRFFVQRNPGHAAGDELCCLAPLTRANFTPAAYRVMGLSPELVETSR